MIKKIKKNKIYAICGLMMVLIITPMINAGAISSWPVQPDTELYFSLSDQYYNRDNVCLRDISASLSVFIKDVDNVITYDVSWEIDEKVGAFNPYLKGLEGTDITSNEEFVAVSAVIIYENSAFAEMESYWTELINTTRENFFVDNRTFGTYSADEIPDMDFSSSVDSCGFEITASWGDYKEILAGNRIWKKTFSQDGILLEYEKAIYLKEGGSNELIFKNNVVNTIPSFPIEFLGYCSILGIVVVFIKRK
jgi:hypothetical protein